MDYKEKIMSDIDELIVLDIKANIDKFLDIYNNYKALHEMFGDSYYLTYMDMALIRISNLVEYMKRRS